MNAVNKQLANINKEKKQRFGQGLTAKEYLKRLETTKWIEKKQTGSKVGPNFEEENVRKNIEFAKNLFVSWDDDGTGTLEASEIIQPLVQLGLAPDSQFARKILNSLDPRSHSEKEKTDLRITLADFIKIFKSSTVSEQLLNIINKETLRRQQMSLRPVELSSLPEKRNDHSFVGHTE